MNYDPSQFNELRTGEPRQYMPKDPLIGYGRRLIEFVVLFSFLLACMVGISFAPEINAALSGWKGSL